MVPHEPQRSASATAVKHAQSMSDLHGSQKYSPRPKRRSNVLLKDFFSVDSLSEEELRAKLREALTALRERERDLQLAAEIGQQLVATNNNLMTEYHDFMTKGKLERKLSSGALPTPKGRLSSRKSRAALKTVQLNSIRIRETIVECSPVRRPSIHEVFDERGGHDPYVASLEKANADLQSCLEASEAELRDTERMHRQVVSHLRRRNEALEDQLRATLQDLRNVEATNAEAMCTLERDLDQLRQDLQITEQTAAELEVDRQRLLHEKRTIRRDSEDMEKSDELIIADLQNHIYELEAEITKLLAAKDKAESRSQVQKEELAKLTDHVKALQLEFESSEDWHDECERQRKIIEELTEQLEDMRTATSEEKAESLLARTSSENTLEECLLPSGYFDTDEDETITGDEDDAEADHSREWDWSHWTYRTRVHLWEMDIQGIKEEIKDLRQNSDVVYLRLRSKIHTCTTQVVNFTPRPIASLANMATNVIVAVVPGRVFKTATAVAKGVQNELERRILGVLFEHSFRFWFSLAHLLYFIPTRCYSILISQV
ncbi:uncharacterized protein EV422DRAFT_307141 [Fimicolochytrium jonesii]|uniref:uncharacterized protein n=1 Tax=Fimicolochytrium jonesii TaxID=1396493 RepID=UPI0022FE3C14|nr:uncharacterized protein EV422DRAFT_307141 [Fimicolochytrium jonesii]KAI8824114.1 hypothetical protein EV422DRAFT_307141 [Fimicolochytrium jonesii]